LQKKVLRFLSLCALIVSATVMAIPIAGLTGALAGGQASAASQTTLRIGFMQKVDSLNPFVGVTDSAYVFYGLVYDALGVIDNQMKPSPDLATSVWAVPTTDPELVASHEVFGSVWQYNLTHHATWTDGEPFLADDVVFNVNMNADNYTILWAYQPYSYWMRHAEKIDDYTVRIHYYNKATGLSSPAAYAYLISIPMLPKHLLQGLDPAYINVNWSGVFEDQPVPLVGTAAFMATSSIYDDFVSGNTITLVKNPNSHWEKEYGKTIKFDKIQLVFYDDATAMSLALQKGDIDASSFPPQAFLQIQQDVASGKLKNIETFSGEKITQYWTEVGINMNAAGGNEARLDLAVRKAMALATDKNYICQQFYLGMAAPGSTLIPPINTYWHYNLTDAEKIPLNYTLANETLQNAGYVWNSAHTVRVATASSLAAQNNWLTEGKPLTFDILIRQDYPEEKDIGTYLQRQWDKIGIHVNLDIVDEATLNTIVYKYLYDFMIWYWSADIDPNYQLFVQSTMSINGWSDNHYENPAYDQNYTNAVMTLNRTERRVYVDNCQRIDYEDCGYIILAYENQTWAWRTDTFDNWGDWATDPGRSIDNFWMGNPLYFDLVPTGAGQPDQVPWLAIGAGIAVIAAIAIAAVVLTRRNKKKEKKDEDNPLEN